MRGDDIIDVDVDPREARRRFWRRFVRFGVPLAGVVLIVGAIIAITFYSYRSNRNDALGLSQNLIAALDQRVAAEVAGYLEPAAQAVRTLADLLPEQGLAPSERPRLEQLMIALLRDRPQLASLYAGDPQGNFLMVQRSATGTLDTKLIEQNGAQRRVTWHRRDETGRIQTVEDDPADTFDPRTRPWYQGASAADGLFWTDVYVFFTDRKPGLTASSARHGPERGIVAVAGGDITLTALSEFLAGLEIGASGRAMVVDAQGRLVAFPDPAAVVDATTEGEFQPARIDAIGEPVLTEAHDRTRVAGAGRSIVEIDDRRYIVAASLLAKPTARDWWLMLVVPEDELVGFVAANSRKTLLMSSGVVALAIGLAALLAYQGLLAERNAWALGRRERALAAQTAAFDELASSTALFEPGDRQALRRLTESVGRTLAAPRVSVWQLDDRHGEIVCLDCFDREAKGHTTGAAIGRVECPELFAALASGDEIAVEDAAQDARTAGLARIYLGPLGCRSLLSVPITGRHGVVGCVWVEDAGSMGRRGVDPQPFARIVAHLLGARLAAGEAEDVRPAVAAAAGGGAAAPGLQVAAKLTGSETALRTASISDERSRALLRQMSGRGLDDDRLIGTLYPHATVLVLRLFDDLAMAAHADPERQSGVIERIVAAFQEIAQRLRVRYVKIMTNEIVAAEGFEGDAHQTALTLGEVALAVQEECARAFADLGGPLDYAIGLDTGMVIGSSVGFGQTAYNIWGDAVRLASSLAATAQRGTIQVSEASYEQLRDRFVFRRRGAFYLEQVGEMTTYVLRGRL